MLLDQAQTRLENAQTDQQRIRAATDIYNLTIAQARLDQEAAKAQVAAAVEKSRVAVENLQLKLKNYRQLSPWLKLKALLPKSITMRCSYSEKQLR